MHSASENMQGRSRASEQAGKGHKRRRSVPRNQHCAAEQMQDSGNIDISSDEQPTDSRRCASEQAKTKRGGWSVKCKRLVELVLARDWNAAMDLASEHESDGFMRSKVINQ